jgi:hypothetical protein
LPRSKEADWTSANTTRADSEIQRRGGRPHGSDQIDYNAYYDRRLTTICDAIDAF